MTNAECGQWDSPKRLATAVMRDLNMTDSRRSDSPTLPTSSTPASGSSFDDGVRLFDCPDLLALGWLANREREKRHGARTYYNFNIRLEATNVCVASCLFCSFARLQPGDAGSYTMSLEQAWDKLRQRAHQPLTEIHVVNGLHPDLPFDYYLELLRGFKRIRPGIHLKCFTAVEIAFFADLYGMTDEQVLRELHGRGARFAAGRRRGDLRRARAPEDLPRQVRRRSLSRRFTGSRIGSACART